MHDAEYDNVVRIRPDLHWRRPLTLPARGVAEGGDGGEKVLYLPWFSRREALANDQVAIAAPVVMQVRGVLLDSVEWRRRETFGLIHWVLHWRFLFQEYIDVFRKTAVPLFSQGSAVHPERTLYDHLASVPGLEWRALEGCDYALGRVVDGKFKDDDPYAKLKRDFPRAFENVR